MIDKPEIDNSELKTLSASIPKLSAITIFLKNPQRISLSPTTQ